MKIARSVRLLRFGGFLVLICIVLGGVVGGHGDLWRHGFAVRIKAGAAGFGVEVGVDGRKRAEEQAADVSEGAGAAWRDAPLGAESVQGSEGMVDALGVLEAKGLLG